MSRLDPKDKEKALEASKIIEKHKAGILRKNALITLWTIAQKYTDYKITSTNQALSVLDMKENKNMKNLQLKSLIKEADFNTIKNWNDLSKEMGKTYLKMKSFAAANKKELFDLVDDFNKQWSMFVETINDIDKALRERNQ